MPDLPTLLGRARQRLDDRAERLRLAVPVLIERRRSALVAAERRLPDLVGLIAASRDRLQDRSLRLVLALPNLVAIRRTGLQLAARGLVAGLRHAVAGSHARGQRVLGRLSDAPLRGALREAHARLEGTAARLESVSPLAVLGRGYALVSDPAGHPLTSAASVKPRARLRLRFADGEVGATADNGRTDGRQREFPL